jgi:hypothetical protein
MRGRGPLTSTSTITMFGLARAAETATSHSCSTDSKRQVPIFGDPMVAG